MGVSGNATRRMAPVRSKLSAQLDISLPDEEMNDLEERPDNTSSYQKVRQLIFGTAMRYVISFKLLQSLKLCIECNKSRAKTC